MKLRITLDGVTYDLEVEFVEEEPGQPKPSPVSTAPKPGASSGAPAAPAAPRPPAQPPPGGGDNTVTSPISGTVFKMLVKVGDAVDTGQDLMILEAMKMETNIVSAGPGTIKNVAVAEGDAVKQGQLLIEFE
jgi:biotin carboxyl carrier protein